MINPWESIKLSDYENHMRLDTVMQLQVLNDMMKSQLNSYPVDSVMILGVAGGNGLEHIDTEKFSAIYGIDINSEYLQEVQKRYGHLGHKLNCLCVDLMSDFSKLPNADFALSKT